MSEKAHASQPLIASPADLLANHGAVVPQSIAEQYGYQTTNTESFAAVTPDTTAELVAVSSEAVTTTADLDALLVTVPAENTEAAGANPSNDDELGADILSSDDSTRTAGRHAERPGRPANTPETPSRLQKLNPMHHARNAAAAIKARQLESGRDHYYGPRVRAAVALGGLAMSVVGAYAAYKGFSAGGSEHATWHDPSTPDTAGMGEHTQPTPDQTPATPEQSAGSSDAHNTSPGVEDRPQAPVETPPAPEQPTTPEETFRKAVGHDNTGRASNVTDWSRQSIYNEAIDEGLSKKQAYNLSHNQDNIDTANNAFFKENKLGDDRMLLEGRRYETTNQNNVADSIIDEYKKDHGITTPGEEAQAAQPRPETTTPATTANTTAPEASPVATPAPEVSAQPTAEAASTPQATPENNPVATSEAAPEQRSMDSGTMRALTKATLAAGGIALISGGYAAREIMRGREAEARREYAFHNGHGIDAEPSMGHRRTLRKRFEERRAAQEAAIYHAFEERTRAAWDRITQETPTIPSDRTNGDNTRPAKKKDTAGPSKISRKARRAIRSLGKN